MNNYRWSRMLSLLVTSQGGVCSGYMVDLYLWGFPILISPSDCIRLHYHQKKTRAPLFSALFPASVIRYVDLSPCDWTEIKSQSCFNLYFPKRLENEHFLKHLWATFSSVENSLFISLVHFLTGPFISWTLGSLNYFCIFWIMILWMHRWQCFFPCLWVYPLLHWLFT